MSASVTYTEVTGPLVRVGVMDAATEAEANEVAAEHLGYDGASPAFTDPTRDGFEVVFEYTDVSE